MVDLWAILVEHMWLEGGVAALAAQPHAKMGAAKTRILEIAMRAEPPGNDGLLRALCDWRPGNVSLLSVLARAE